MPLILFSSSCRKQTQNGNPQYSIAIGKNLWNTLPLLAENLGYFSDEDLDISLVYQDAGRYCMEALVSGSADFAAVVEANVAYIAFNGEQDLKILGNIVSSSCAIIGREDKGIMTPSDLIGKSIAYVPATGAEPYLFNYLKKYDISTEDVILKKMQPKSLQFAVANGDVDAASTWEPFIFNIQRNSSSPVVVFREPDVFTGYMMLATKSSRITELKSDILKLERALSKTSQYINENPEEAKITMAKLLNANYELIDGIWANFNFGYSQELNESLEATRAVGRDALRFNAEIGAEELPEYEIYFK